MLPRIARIAHTTGIAFLGLLAGACAGAPDTATAPQSPKEVSTATQWRGPPPSIDGRLAPGVTPKRYAVDFDVDPSKERFSGHVRIDVDIAAPTSAIVLHGRDLTIARVSAIRSGIPHGARLATRRPSTKGADPDELVLAFEPPLPAGNASLDIDYEAPFGRSLAGLYRARDRDRDYAFTQFEPTDARRAFPCFDEPQFKTPYEISVRVPDTMIALSNAPERARTRDAGHVRFAFQPTLPIPSYLVAVAAGDFDVISDSNIPNIRMVTTKGRAESARTALAPAKEILAALERYLGVAYPYPKLDLVAVPDFGAGAMENPGLITFRGELLLADPKRSSPSATRSREHLFAHEFAHQWFGNLVTMAWWDDLWLNESFATWLSAKILDELRPSNRIGVGVVRSAIGVMEPDALPTSRAVRRPVKSSGDANEAFDGMTYEKGAAVIHMLETSLGAERFRARLKTYLETYGHKNARTEDFLAVIANGEPDTLAVANAFLDQPGVPTVSVERDCRRKDAAVVLSQYPWAAVGSPPPQQPLRQWTIPLCMREAGRANACTILKTRRTELPLANGCKGWIYPNAAEASYVRLALPSGEVNGLVEHLRDLDVRERLGLLANVWAGVRSGELGADTLVSTLKAYDGERTREITEQMFDILGLVRVMVPNESSGRYRDFVRARMLPRKRALTWGAADALLGAKRAPPDDDEARLHRGTVLYTLGEVAEDDDTLKEAETIAQAWLRDPKSLDTEIAGLAVELASRRAGATRFEELVRAIKALDEPRDRIVAIRALGAFDDPNLVMRALDFAIDGGVSIGDTRYVFDGALRHRRSLETVLGWVEANWDRAARRFDGPHTRRLISPVFGICDKSALESARSFFKVHPVEGGARYLEDAIAQASRCATLAEALRPSLTAALPRAR
jgi:aminopeptidase N